MPVTDLVKVQVGQENVAWGTCVVATAKLMGVTGANLQVVDEVYHTDESGRYYPSQLVAQVSQMGEGAIEMDLSYEHILYPLENFFDAVEDHTGTATGPWSWDYNAPDDDTVEPQHMTIEFGAPDAEYEACGVLFTELNISGEAGGVWKGNFPFICQDVATGSMATIADYEAELIRMADTIIHVDTWSGTIGTTDLENTLISFDMSVKSGRHLKFYAADDTGTALVARDWGDTQWSGTLTTVMEFNATAKAYVDAILGGGLVQRMIRIQATSGTSVATLDFYGTLVNGAELFSDRDGNVTVSLEWEGTYNETDDLWHHINIVNSIKTLT